MEKLSKKFAFVLVPRPDITLLCYIIPENIEISVGDCVEIELKKSKIWGIVQDISELLPEKIKEMSLKPVLGKIFSSTIFSDKHETAFLKWFADYYLYSFPKIIKQIFSPIISNGNSLIGNSDIDKHLSSLCECENSPKPELNSDQTRVVKSITDRWNKKDFKPVVVFGVTGSGKSEVFSTLCQETIKKGKQILYLVPEVGLTSRALKHLISRIGAPGVILHSFMTRKKRFSAMYCAINKKATIIVGTRSSILYPFFDIGLIIIDEEHDTSYKNLEQPYYNARDAAVMKGLYLNIPVVMGSATPSSDSWYNCTAKKYYIEKIITRANKKPLPEIKTFKYKGDMYIPSELVNLVKNSILNKEQSLFFLNRRGFATLAVCPDCGETTKCPNCNTALIYHKKIDKLLCHHCNFSKNTFLCGKCDGILEFEGMGVEKLNDALFQYFPDSKIISFDKDNLNTLSLFDKAVDEISKNRYNIIVGTVMISKGHNFPMLKNVIIKFADYILSFNDTRAAEKCFQLITQVAGRAGRFETAGIVYAESVYPDHYLWKYVTNHDYEGFIEEELLWRKKLFLPPYSKMTIIKISGTKEYLVNNAADDIHNLLKCSFDKIRNIGFVLFPPIEPPLSKTKNRFRKNISIISPKNSKAFKILKDTLLEIPRVPQILITFDVDPVNET